MEENEIDCQEQDTEEMNARALSYDFDDYVEYEERQTVLKDTEVELDDNPFERYGYKFVGWNTVQHPTSTNPGKWYRPQDGDTEKPIFGTFPASTTLYAQWEKTKCNVHFILEDEDASFQPRENQIVTVHQADNTIESPQYQDVTKEVYFEETLPSGDFPKATRPGYVCTGWLTVDGVRFTTSVKVVRDMDVYPRWEESQETPGGDPDPGQTPTPEPDPTQDEERPSTTPQPQMRQYTDIDGESRTIFTKSQKQANNLSGKYTIYSRFLSEKGGRSYVQGGTACPHYTMNMSSYAYDCTLDPNNQYFKVKVMTGHTPTDKEDWSTYKHMDARTYQPPYSSD